MRKTFYIIDSETSTIDRLKEVFEDFPKYSLAGFSDNYDRCMNTILKYSPELIFANIDLYMGEHSVFHFANELHQYRNAFPTFIAITSFRSKSYEVIKHNFYDILLKPVSEADLRRTMLRFEKRQEVDEPRMLCLKSYKDYRFINTDEIIYLKADNNSTDLFMDDGRVISGYQTMKYFEVLLPNHFVRIHHSYIININHLIRIHFGKSKCTLRTLDKNIPFSRTYRANVEFMTESLAKSALLTLN